MSSYSYYVYNDVLKKIIYEFKYKHNRSIFKLVYNLIYERQKLFRLPPSAILVPVPLHPQKLKERGYNQANELSKVISQIYGLDIVDCLERVKYTQTQTKMSVRKRKENVNNAFSPKHEFRDTLHRDIIIVDDVITSGSTINECAKCFSQAGQNIHALSLAIATHHTYSQTTSPEETVQTK